MSNPDFKKYDEIVETNESSLQNSQIRSINKQDTVEEIHSNTQTTSNEAKEILKEQQAPSFTIDKIEQSGSRLPSQVGQDADVPDVIQQALNKLDGTKVMLRRKERDYMIHNNHHVSVVHDANTEKAYIIDWAAYVYNAFSVDCEQNEMISATQESASETTPVIDCGETLESVVETLKKHISDQDAEKFVASAKRSLEIAPRKISQYVYIRGMDSGDKGTLLQLSDETNNLYPISVF